MAYAASCSIQGGKELVEELKKLGLIPQADPFRKDLLKGARRLRDAIRAAAPKGPPDPSRFSWAARKKGLATGAPGRGTMYRGGNLRRGIISGKKFGKRYPYDPTDAAAYVGVHYRIAPHINFIERGARLTGKTWVSSGRSGGLYETGIRAVAGKTTGKKALRLYGYKGKKIFAAWAMPGPMQPKPFFHKTVEANRARFEQYIGLSAWKWIKGARFEYIRPQD